MLARVTGDYHRVPCNTEGSWLRCFLTISSSAVVDPSSTKLRTSWDRGCDALLSAVLMLIVRVCERATPVYGLETTHMMYETRSITLD